MKLISREDDKFNDLDKHLNVQTIIEKLNEGFDLLFQFNLIYKNQQHPSYAHSVELEVIIKEMVAYEYPIEKHWIVISMFGKKKMNTHPLACS